MTADFASLSLTGDLLRAAPVLLLAWGRGGAARRQTTTHPDPQKAPDAKKHTGREEGRRRARPRGARWYKECYDKVYITSETLSGGVLFLQGGALPLALQRTRYPLR